MSYGETRYYLHNWEALKEDIQILQSDIDSYKKMDISSIKISRVTDMPRSASTETSSLETLVLDRLTHIMRLENELLYLKMMHRSIQSTINKLNTREAKIIHMRYLDRETGKRQPTYEMISRKVHLCISYIKHIDNRICEKIQERFNVLFDSNRY